MNQLIKNLQEIIDKKADNNDIKKELTSLNKMLKSGFEKKNVGMEKVPKLFATNDNDKIKKFYETIGNQINALKISGNLDKFVEYLSINFGINIKYDSDSSPNINYIKKGKKYSKFSDLYTSYFLEDLPKSPKDAIAKILTSLDNLTKEYTKENDLVKESLKVVIEQQNEHSPDTVKTVDKILTSARLKDLGVDEVANTVETKLNLQQQAVDLVLKENQK